MNGRQAAALAARVDADLGAQRDLWSRGFTRRRFLTGAGMVAAASLGSQLVTTRYAYAQPGTSTGATMVVVFLRGGFDGLAAVVPGADPDYRIARPTIGIPASSLLSLDRRFGLHPALGPLYPLWQRQQLAVVHASGFPDVSRSHFQAQDTIERGVTTPSTTTGWLERALAVAGPGTTFRAVGEGVALPQSLAGSLDALALAGLDSLVLQGSSQRYTAAIQGLYTGLDHPAVEQVGKTVQALQAAADLQRQTYVRGATYPAGEFADALRDVARLVKIDAGLRLATIDVGGWDLHTNAGTVAAGDMTDHLGDLAAGLAAFATDLGERLGDVTLVTMSEFGRRVEQNASGGTDHGHGNVMFILGGPVAGGVVHGAWPGLTPGALVQGDLAPVNDYRDVLAEITQRQLGIASFSTIFPGHVVSPLGVMRA